MIDEAVLNQAQENLRLRAAALENVQFADPPIRRDFTFQEIRAGFERGAISGWIRKKMGEEKNSAAIYRFTVNNQNGADKLQQAFNEHEEKDGHVFARNNHVTDSTTIYVGSSRNVGQRLQQHLHTCAKGTYALKMNLWCRDEDYRVTVEVSYILGAAQPSLIQDVEDALWRRSRPMFGKFGAQ